MYDEIKKYEHFIEEEINENLKNWIVILSILYNTGIIPDEIKNNNINNMIEYVKKLPGKLIDSVKFIDYVYHNNFNDKNEYDLWQRFKKNNPEIKTDYEDYKKIKKDLLYYDDVIIEITYIVNIFVLITLFIAISITLFKKIKNDDNNIELLKIYYKKINDMRCAIKKYNNKDIDSIYNKFIQIFDEYINDYNDLISESKLKKIIGIINDQRNKKIDMLVKYYKALNFLHKRWDFYVNCLEDIKNKIEKKEIDDIINCIYMGYNKSLEIKQKFNTNINVKNPDVLVDEVNDLVKIIDKMSIVYDKSLKYAIKLLNEYNIKRNKILSDYIKSNKYYNYYEKKYNDVFLYDDIIKKCSSIINNNKKFLTDNEHKKCIDLLCKIKNNIETCKKNKEFDKIYNEISRLEKQICDIIKNAKNRKNNI